MPRLWEAVQCEGADVLSVLAHMGLMALAQAVVPQRGRVNGMKDVKMDREQFKALIGMLDAIYAAVRGWEGPSPGRTEALDYVGAEQGRAKGWLPEDRSDSEAPL